MNQLVRFLVLIGASLVVSCHHSKQAAPKAPAEAVQARAPEAQDSATGWQRPFLYRVNAVPQPFFVFGTIHLPDERLEQFPVKLAKAFNESSAVYTEIPMDGVMQSSLVSRMVLPRDQSLKVLLPAPLHENLARVFGEQGVSFVMFEQVKPWFVSMQLTLLDRLQAIAQNQPLDMLLYQRAELAGKEVGGLETAEEQMALFDELSLEEQVEMLAQAYDQREKARIQQRDILGELLEAYVTGSEAEVMRLIREGYEDPSPLSIKLNERVFTNRNRSLTERIVAQVKMAPNKIRFFAVGCGHVVGDDGIVAKLRAQGYKTERL